MSFKVKPVLIWMLVAAVGVVVVCGQTTSTTSTTSIYQTTYKYEPFCDPSVFTFCTNYDTKWDGDRLYMYPRTDQNRNQTFNNGQAFCELHGGTLVSIRSMAEHKFISDWIHDWSLRSEEFWLGLYKEEIGGSWVWTDGSPADFTSWAPNNPIGGGCGLLSLSSTDYSTYLWQNFPCNLGYRRHIICQIKY